MLLGGMGRGENVKFAKQIANGSVMALELCSKLTIHSYSPCIDEEQHK